MRLWSLLVCVAVLLVCAITGFAYVGQTYIPTDANDHLLDNVKGLGGPKK